jgi:hypothetical protein
LNYGRLKSSDEVEVGAEKFAREASAVSGLDVRFMNTAKVCLFKKVQHIPVQLAKYPHRVIGGFPSPLIETMVDMFGRDCVIKTVTQVRAKLADQIWPGTSDDGIEAVDGLIGFTKGSGM